jgi:putative FmdB family regulatory protein
MPRYDYFCEFQNKEFEQTHSINEELEECPLCKEAGKEPHKPQRLISATSFQLIGGGWSKDNYSSK